MERLLGSRMLFRATSASRQNKVLILAYHNVLPAGEPPVGDRSLHIPLDRFREHLDLLSERFAIVGLEEALTHRSAQPRVVITFDDAYAGALQFALPELANRGIAATVFVTPGLLGGGPPWWVRLGEASGGLRESLREECLTRHAGNGEAILRAYSAPPPSARLDRLCRIATEGELTDAARLPRMTFGAHTWNHPVLPRVPDASLAEELTRPLAWLAERFPANRKPWLAYPYGLEDERVGRAARTAGYEQALLIHGRWFLADAWENSLPRLNVPAGFSPAGLGARLSGLL